MGMRICLGESVQGWQALQFRGFSADILQQELFLVVPRLETRLDDSTSWRVFKRHALFNLQPVRGTKRVPTDETL
jgi:hypothetical protein